jgi:CRISPR-associated protein Cmr1
MAREVKIKVKNDKGEFEFKKIEFLPEVEVEALEEMLKKSEFKFSDKGNQKTKIIRETREYELITPLFGGGAENKKADEISIIRATEIRGHLRFWWRATRGGQFSTIEELKKHEDAIFGSTEKHSPLQIEIEIMNRGNAFPNQPDYNGNLQTIGNVRSPFSYVSFPLRDERTATVIENISFQIRISFPQKYDEDVTASLWAWETFGGLGARTRRGFGAIQNKHYLPNVVDVSVDIQSGLAKCLKGNNSLNDVPRLNSNFSGYKITNSESSVIDAWKYIIDKLQSFRQNRTRRFGRSRWSEPDAIRRRFPALRHPLHSTPITSADKFPRANFGLPIEFKFTDDGMAAGDPPKTRLEGASENQKRLASPLVFRPIKCNGNKFVGIACVLSGIRLPTSGVMLKDAPTNPIVNTDLTSAEASSIGLNSILSGNPNILEAFLATL